MLNQVVLVGRLVYDLQLKKNDSGKKYLIFTLAIPRSFKNLEGNYDTDFIRCIVWDSIAENTSLYCHKGDIVGVKGRLQSRVLEKKDKKETIMEVIGEKVTFLTSSKAKEEKTQLLFFFCFWYYNGNKVGMLWKLNIMKISIWNL